MKAEILISAVIGLAGGAIGSIIATSGTGDSELGSAASTRDVAELRDAIDTLRTENSDLKARLDSFEHQPVVADTPMRINADDAKANPSTLDPELKDLVASLRDPNARLPENFRDEISAVYADIKAAEEQKRKDDQKKRDQERFDQRLAEMTKELGLNAFQTDEMRKSLTAAEEKRDALRDQWRNNDTPGDNDKMRAAMEQLRADSRTDLSRFLNGQQLQTYEEKYSNNRGFGGRGGNGGGRGPGGNGGGGSNGAGGPGGGTTGKPVSGG